MIIQEFIFKFKQNLNAYVNLSLINIINSY